MAVTYPIISPELGDLGDPAWAANVTEAANDHETSIGSLIAPGWTDFSSSIAWTSTGTQPAFGTTAKVAAYRRPTDSDVVDYYWKLTFATATFGTGVYSLSLPVTAHSSVVNTAIGQAYSLDLGTQEFSGIVKCQTSTTIIVVVPSGGGWAATVPQTWANGDILSGWVRYRPA